MSTRVVLIDNAAVPADAGQWRGGRGALLANGTFSGASIAFRTKAGDNATWLTVATVTAPGIVNFELPEGTIDAEVTGGPPSGITMVAAPIR